MTDTLPSDRAIRSVRRRATVLWVEGSVGLVLLIAASVWGTVSWNRSFAAGQRPAFYQQYFEPAVMIACGKGFVVTEPQVPAIASFLGREVDRFSCDAIPPGVRFEQATRFQRLSRYLMLTVGTAWRLLGISWSGIGPLFGALFGATIVAAYAIFRLGMGRLLAGVGAVALSLSPLHLMNLPRLRDYAKAPFTLILIFLLALLVKRRPARSTVLAIAAAYGAVLGVGYGFRTDFLVNIPAFFLTLMLFLEGGVFRNMRLKVAAATLCAMTFLATGWPTIYATYESGGCQWHVALLGFSAHFSGPLGVEQPPYQLSRVYSDAFVATTVRSYAARMQPSVGPIEFCQSEYDAATGRYLRDLVRHFPADMIVRAYASTLRIVELPFIGRPETRPDGENAHSENQAPGSPSVRGIGLGLVVAAIGLATRASPRLGLFLIFFLLYFGGYPAVQFDARHYFHLEFITWWAAGFLLQSAVIEVRRLVRERQWDPALAPSFQRAALIIAGCAAALVLSLWAARAYQQGAVRRLFESYLAAARQEIPVEKILPVTLHPRARPSSASDPETADLVEVDVNVWQCVDNLAVTFRYDQAVHPEFLRTFVVQRRESIHEPTRILMPVYDGFQGIELSDTSRECLDRVYRVRNPGQFSLLLEAILPPRWENLPLYQRFGAVGPPQVDASP